MLTERGSRIALIFAALALTVSPAWAIRVVGPGESGSSGFFLRLSAGFGAQNTAAVVPFLGPGEGEMKFEGDGADINIAIGGFVAEDLALHATLFGWTATNPDVSWGRATLPVPGDLSLGAFGAGLTWYALPSGLYLSGSLGFADLNIEDAESDTGIALDLTLGKEWWVSSSWSLGLAGAFGWHNVPEAGLNDDWSGQSFGLRFSASMR